MSSQGFVIVGLGELLWDLLPGGRQLGGAPANFAYHASSLGDRGIVASRVGIDAPGREAIDRLEEIGLITSYVQRDEAHPTGTVLVQVDDKGQPCYTISENVAWDFLEWTDEWQKLAGAADAVCFGSLAQRTRQSKNTLRRFLEATRPDALRIFDVNLRQTFYSVETLDESLKLADAVKLNAEELPRVIESLGLDGGSEETRARRLIEAYDLELVCITRGGCGSLLVN